MACIGGRHSSSWLNLNHPYAVARSFRLPHRVLSILTCILSRAMACIGGRHSSNCWISIIHTLWLVHSDSLTECSSILTCVLSRAMACIGGRHSSNCWISIIHTLWLVHSDSITNGSRRLWQCHNGIGGRQWYGHMNLNHPYAQSTSRTAP